MCRFPFVVLGLWLAGTLAASAQDLPEGTFASAEEGCAALNTKTPAELGENLDFYVLDRSGIASFGQRCEFVSVTPRAGGRWLATAFCDEDGFVYPDFFAIAQKDDGSLAVTRSTDFTQQTSDVADQPSLPTEDMNPSELEQDPEEAEAEAQMEEPVTKPDAFNIYVRCGTVKK